MTKVHVSAAHLLFENRTFLTKIHDSAGYLLFGNRTFLGVFGLDLDLDLGVSFSFAFFEGRRVGPVAD